MSVLLLTRSRGPALEAEHWGCVAVVNSEGKSVFAAGDVDRPFYPRSAIKLIHALPLLETGAATAYVCSPQEITLAAASHTGDDPFVEVLHGWAQRIGVPEEQLICGVDRPLSPRVADSVIRGSAVPRVFHNNNAGKHLAIVTTARHLGEPISGYEALDHPVQRNIMRTVSTLCETTLPIETFANDNCGLPTFPVSAHALALGMARLGGDASRDPGSAGGCLIRAIRSAPEWLAGPRRLVTRIISMTGGRIIAKGGSEGVFSVTIPDLGLGICVKVNDGSGEACSAILIELLVQLGLLADRDMVALRQPTNAWRKPETPERSLQLEFPVFAEMRPAGKPMSCARFASTTPLMAGETQFIDSEGRECTDTPFQFGVIRHKQLPREVLLPFAHFAVDCIKKVSRYLGVQLRSGIVIQLVGRDNRSMTFLGDRRIRVSLHRLPHESCLHHELTHILAGLSALGSVFTEGLAVHVQALFGGVEDRSYPTFGRDLHELARDVLWQTSEDRSVKMEANGKFDLSEDLSTRVTDYILCGSFVRSIIEDKGITQFMLAYRNTSLVDELPTLEKVWRQKLASP